MTPGWTFQEGGVVEGGTETGARGNFREEKRLLGPGCYGERARADVVI